MSAALGQMIESFPVGLPIPDPFIRYFAWLDQYDLFRAFDNDGGIYSPISPDDTSLGMSIESNDPDFLTSYTGNPCIDTYDRFATFCRTGSDGSHAALWRNDDGLLRIVHLGSGSGSTMLGTLTDNPIDFLRLLAIGYEELCWPEDHDMTPLEVLVAKCGDIGGPNLQARSVALRNWVEATFAVKVPEKASDIIGVVADMDAQRSDDEFWLWTRGLAR
jgi:hypothetical protein